MKGPLRPLAVLMLVATAAVYAVAALPAGHRATPYLSIHAVMFALMLAAWRLAKTHEDTAFAVRVGIASRVALLAAPTFTTTDVTRYLWDGAVALSGRDPYLLSPDSQVLATLHARLPSDHLDVATCYPPAAVALFMLAALTGPSLAWWTWKLLVVAASSATSLLAWNHLKNKPNESDAVLAAWCPVLILESGVGAHLDAFTALAVVAGVTLVARKREGAAALALGCGVAVKLLPAVALLALAGSVRRPVWFLARAMAPLALSFAVAEGIGCSLPGSLPFVAENWSFAAPLWTLLYSLMPTDDAVTRRALALSLIAAVMLISMRRDPARAARDGLTAQLVASPVAYPWYGSGLAAVSAMAPSWLSLAAVAALPFSYEVLDGYQGRGAWLPAWWPVALNAAAIVGGLGAEAVAAAGRFRRALRG
ncbi:MAG: glycosyltransferase 87 family protein [Polyangiales bacterium]